MKESMKILGLAASQRTGSRWRRAGLGRSGVPDRGRALAALAAMSIALLFTRLVRWIGITPALTRWFDRKEPAEEEDE